MEHRRHAPLEMSPEEFKTLGYQLVDHIADFLGSLPHRPVTPGETPRMLRETLGNNPLPAQGTDPRLLLERAADLLFDHSTFNGHPRFWGYITSSAAPIGALGDLLAAAVNPNVGAGVLSPIATEIEAQTVRWIAELLGYPSTCGGLLVSGGNMANFVPFLAARRAQTDWDIRTDGMNHPDAKKLRVYASAETHTWLQKATDLFGLGTNAIRWIPADDQQRMNVDALRRQIEDDRGQGDLPLMVIGTAGTVSTGAVDPLPAIARLCREYKLWFHVDGAYGAIAAALPDAPTDLYGLREADSVAVDPHKWLYAPVEAGCVLVRDAQTLLDAFSYHPVYYHFHEQMGDDAPFTNYYEYGMQNSRGFRALKVWLALQQVGREGYIQMLQDDIRLAHEMFERVRQTPQLEAYTCNLSITTFRYIPEGFDVESAAAEEYLNHLNEQLLTRIQNSGEAFLSNAVINGKYLLRACIVNFRTSQSDIEALPEIITRLGHETDQELRPQALRSR